jgi:hypothetical protein
LIYEPRASGGERALHRSRTRAVLAIVSDTEVPDNKIQENGGVGQARKHQIVTGHCLYYCMPLDCQTLPAAYLLSCLSGTPVITAGLQQHCQLYRYYQNIALAGDWST